jgi:hypothetical protein
MSRTLVCVIEGPHCANHSVPQSVAKELAELRAENARLLRLLKLTRTEAAPPGPAQSGLFDAPPGPVHAGSPAEAKVALFGALFAARTDVYAAQLAANIPLSRALSDTKATTIRPAGTPIDASTR